MVTPTNEVERLFPARVKSILVLMRFEAQKPMARVTRIYKGMKVTRVVLISVKVLIRACE